MVFCVKNGQLSVRYIKVQRVDVCQVGKFFRIICSSDGQSIFDILNVVFLILYCCRLGRPTITANGKGLCEVRATATESGKENETLAKTIFIFSNLQKKMKWFFAGTA